MSWLTGQRGASTYICPDDKYVTKSSYDTAFAEGSKLYIQRSFVCPHCRRSLINMGRNWRAPKKSNKKAWQSIQNGNALWDEKALALQDRRAADSTEYSNYHKWREAKRRRRDRFLFIKWYRENLQNRES